MSLLNNAWKFREELGLFEKTEVLRVFHGPGEGAGKEGTDKFGGGLLRNFALDRFGDHYWITHWEKESFAKHSANQSENQSLDQIIAFLRSKGAVSIVGLSRPQQGVPSEPVTFFGTPFQGKKEFHENGLKFWIQLQGARHPGLFLDHLPLRNWLRMHSQGLKVLNTFSYTGSLSIAAAVGAAQEVTTLDLSKPVIQWAKENWTLNQLPESAGKFISGDVFEWLPRLKKQKEMFDCIILDPPSFSHGNKGKFSTSKDLEKLHFLAMDLLNRNGILVTSINSSNISWKKYETDVLAAAKSHQMKFVILQKIGLPETFPTYLGQEEDQYLKGWILKRRD